LKKIDDLKAVCRDAETDNIEVNKQLSKIKGGKISNENIIYLNESELEKIENLTLESDKLENARKWLLLGCNLGQRGSDLLSLSASNIKTRNGLHVIELEQQKTKAKISIPVLDKTAEIIKNGLPKKISIQNFNFYIKELCKIAELNEPTKGRKAAVRKEVKRVKGEKKQGHIRRKLGTYPKHELTSSHICRRSFASNLYGKMPTSLIMRITGHKTEKMLLQYIGKSDLDYAQQIADFYELQKLKAKRETTLKVVNQ
jgi:integrase